MLPGMTNHPPFAALVQRQLEAYNARDAGAFAACFSTGVRCQRHPDEPAFLVGRAALHDYYTRERFVHEGLHAQLVHRIELGARVLDAAQSRSTVASSSRRCSRPASSRTASQRRRVQVTAITCPAPDRAMP